MADKMVKVKAVTSVRDNGKDYAPGAEFEMEESLVKPHVAAGQVEQVKQQGSPRDKQFTGGANKKPREYA